MVWIQTGFAMVILSAAMRNIPDEVTEAAMLDGASNFRTVPPGHSADDSRDGGRRAHHHHDCDT
jgi:hypothetical protein